MPKRMTLRAATAMAVLVLLATAGTAPAFASDPPGPPIEVGDNEARLRFVPLGIGKSVIIDLPRDVKDVLVADPTIANAVVRSTRRAYLIGVKVGQTNVFFFDAHGRQIVGLDIAVKRDLNGIRAAFRQTIPGTDIRVEGIGDGVVLSGTVSTPAESQQAFDLASRLVGDLNRVVNGITIKGRDQVMLKVTVAEIQRDIIKQLGIDLNGSLAFGHSVLDFNIDNPFSASNGPISNTFVAPSWVNPGNRITATLKAMERAGVVRTLAEPNLTAISGETANFLAGGEFPIPAGATCDAGGINCRVQIQFKKFGIGLTFTPVVLSEGRISLKVGTEVSELSNEGALAQAGLVVPSLRVRRADTTVEIPSGGALAMAGLIQEQTKQSINGIPGLLQVPILGTLFKSRDFVNRQSELVILVTPYVVRAVAQKQLSKPDDGFADPSDAESVLLSRLNRIYGPPSRAAPRLPYHGKYGFILD
jgi:pilus assembly protein CpaC